LTFKEDKTTEKPTFTLHGHGSAPYDPTKRGVFFNSLRKYEMLRKMNAKYAFNQLKRQQIQRAFA